MKRFLATILTLSLVFSLFAIPVSADDHKVAGEFEVGGNIVVLDHVIEVTVPTAAFSFVVDPEGVIPDNAAGAINFINGTPSFINSSSTAIQLGVEARITTSGPGTEGNTTRVTPVTDGDVGTAGDTEKQVYVTATPSASNVAVVGGSFGDTSSNRTALETNPTLFTFVLPAANYKVEGTVAEDNMKRVLDEDAPALQGTQIQLAGKVTPNPNLWTGNEDFGVRVRFSFTIAPIPYPGTAMAGSEHLRQIEANTEVFATMDVGPTKQEEEKPTATATLNPSGTMLTILAENFEFPENTSGWRLEMFSVRDSGMVAVGSEQYNRVSGSEIRVTLTNAWSNTGAHQGTTAESRYVLDIGTHTITVIKPNSNASELGEVTVEAK